MTLDTFTFDDVDFKRFSFNLNSESSIIPTKKIKEKGVILSQLRFENNRSENFGVIQARLEYTPTKELK